MASALDAGRAFRGVDKTFGKSPAGTYRRLPMGLPPTAPSPTPETSSDEEIASSPRPVRSSDPPPLLPESKRGSLTWRIRGMIRTIRPHQWMKNTFVLAPLVFAKHLSIILRAVGAFGVFCLLAGAVYTLNDLVDVEADRAHPIKCKRPIAAGQVPPALAKVMLVVLLAIALTGAWIGPWRFGLCATSYFVLNIAYSFRLKKIAYLDVIVLASFFVLRVLAGGYAIKTDVSWYLIACTALLALFLGLGKRRHELGSANASKQRAALEAYSPAMLTYALAVTGFAAVATYFFYTLDSHTEEVFQSSYLWLTTIHPLIGVARFVQLVISRPRSESPTQEMLRDVPFMLNLVCWAAECVVIVYRLRPS